MSDYFSFPNEPEPPDKSPGRVIPARDMLMRMIDC